jgi:hypothetical protein
VIHEEEEELLDIKEEVQGQISKPGKPPLDAYLVLKILLLHYYKFL